MPDPDDPPITTTRAYRRLMGRPDPAPVPVDVPGHVWVLADATAGDDITGLLAALAVERRRDGTVRVIYAVGDDEGTLVDCWLAPEQLAPAPGERPSARRSA